MQKLTALHQYLIKNLPENSVHSNIKQGYVTSFQGEDNTHLEIRYQADITIAQYTGCFSELIYLISQWFIKHQPYIRKDSIPFVIDNHTDSTFDITLQLTLTETIKADKTQQTTDFLTCDEPNLTTTLLPKYKWDFTINHNNQNSETTSSSNNFLESNPKAALSK